MGTPLDSIAMRAMVRGWARGNQARVLVVSEWISRDPSERSERAIAQHCGVPVSSARRWIRDFRRVLNRARAIEREFFATPDVFWVVPLTRLP